MQDEIAALNFQLPLSGSRASREACRRKNGVLTFNSLSRDHITQVVRNIVNQLFAFNSLSRDHKTLILEKPGCHNPNLSTPSLGITRAMFRSLLIDLLRPFLSTPSLGITQIVFGIVAFSIGRELSTPSLGITCVTCTSSTGSVIE